MNGCPGRYALTGGPTRVSPRELLGQGARIDRFDRSPESDNLFVARFEGGGLISYEKADGSFIHTLNDEQGLERKLDDLGIER